MARDTAELLAKLGERPALAVGHSAGAAILCRMSLDGALPAKGLVSLNGAMLPLGGVPGQMFAPLARLLVGLPLLPNLFAWRATDQRVVERLLAGTGSRLDARGVALYARVVRQPTARSRSLAHDGELGAGPSWCETCRALPFPSSWSPAPATALSRLPTQPACAT